MLMKNIISKIANKTYTGKALTTTIKITDANGDIIDSKYYSVTYSNNTNIGTCLGDQFSCNWSNISNRRQFFNICIHQSIHILKI